MIKAPKVQSFYQAYSPQKNERNKINVSTKGIFFFFRKKIKKGRKERRERESIEKRERKGQ